MQLSQKQERRREAAAQQTAERAPRAGPGHSVEAVSSATEKTSEYRRRSMVVQLASWQMLGLDWLSEAPAGGLHNLMLLDLV